MTPEDVRVNELCEEFHRLTGVLVIGAVPVIPPGQLEWLMNIVRRAHAQGLNDAGHIISELFVKAAAAGYGDAAEWMRAHIVQFLAGGDNGKPITS
jgi:hypothetical protein